MKYGRQFYLTCLSAAAAMTCGMVAAPAVFAAPPPPAPSACDPDYYDTLKSRAWLEAQREITQNQNLISKPDSVLRYSCFDKALDDYESAASGMFSQGVDLSTPRSAAEGFVNSNFANVHSDMIGGRAGVQSALDGSCGAMAAVWEEAQCMNFADEPDSDAFFTLAEYESDSNDKRFELNCSKSSAWTSEWEALLDVNTVWEEDLAITFLEQLDPERTDCSASGMIDTGLQAIMPPSGDGYSGVYNVRSCLVQGCAYIPTSEDAGECQLYAP